MENKIEYILYESEKNNEYINKLKPINAAVKKIIRTDNGVIMESFYDFSKYKNVRILSDLSEKMGKNEYLIIDLNQVKSQDELKKEEDKLYPKIIGTIQETHIIPYIYHAPEKQQTNERQVGEKLCFIKYDDPNKERISLRNSYLVQIKTTPEQTCTWETISFTSKSKRELDQELSYNFGDSSGLYYLISNEEAENLESYYEITKTEDGTWEFIKKYNGKNK